ncbi:hypothetical protein DICSQDRAFT_140005 [Dichomitus squalens LYAD-421 SS1]|uniref:Uncharacterized protein n=1 Tax=Dichomitus squalens (strain LYAD-421) TaxID=732165 RepID=R7SNS4_DICSQ|nr:uncharacterized protein DICSQDRAFT_140005 [Dichomitus squalens LYAD-421 SS1]EJF57844.1 hypothetical protein DICSQDRAFT_140005 [Dichomitus squalens LYAD-421 SS1]
MPYEGFLGSEGSRFYGQHTNDIHYYNYLPPGLDPKVRQRASAIAQGLTFISAERRVAVHLKANGWPIHEVWVPSYHHFWFVRVLIRGPSQPGWFPPWPQPVEEQAAWAWVGGQWRPGHPIRWFYESIEWQMDVDGVPIPLFYHEHERRERGEHYITLRVEEEGKSCEIENLCFGTQLQIYRRAEND